VFNILEELCRGIWLDGLSGLAFEVDLKVGLKDRVVAGQVPVRNRRRLLEPPADLFESVDARTGTTLDPELNAATAGMVD